MKRQYLIFLSCVFTLVISGCFRSEEKVTDTSEPAMSASEFACKYKLNSLPPMNNGAYGFRAENSVLLLYPGLNSATFKGRVLQLPLPPRVDANGLQIPLLSINALPQEILRREKMRLKKTLVIIDPGHGGHDPGAVAGSMREKDITLAIAQNVAERLRAQGIPVKLTRNDDTFLSLRQRCAIANTNPGAIFVSIHANASSSPQAYGVETYYISPKISDHKRAKLAISRYVLGSSSAGRYSKDNSYIKAKDLSEKYRTESKKLATTMQQLLAAYTKDKNRGVKSANYAVLRESFFGPGVLTEIGFVSNRQTRSKLLTESYKNQIATALAMAISGYIKSCN